MVALRFPHVIHLLSVMTLNIAYIIRLLVFEEALLGFEVNARALKVISKALNKAEDIKQSKSIKQSKYIKRDEDIKQICS